MREVKNNFKFQDQSKIKSIFLQRLEQKEELTCTTRGMCFGFSGYDIPEENCAGVSSNGGCGINTPGTDGTQSGNAASGCGINMSQQGDQTGDVHDTQPSGCLLNHCAAHEQDVAVAGWIERILSRFFGGGQQ